MININQKSTFWWISFLLYASYNIFMGDEIKVSIVTKKIDGAKKQIGCFTIPTDVKDVTVTVGEFDVLHLVAETPLLALPENLTRRESQAAAHMQHGYRRKEIAQMMCIAESTAKSFIESVLVKCDCKSTTEFILKYGCR